MNTISSPSAENETRGIESVQEIDPQEFFKEFIARNRPLIMTGMMTRWSAMKRWSFEFFRDLQSEESVLLEEGNVMQEKTSFRKESFSDYISKLINDSESGERKAYLSVFPLFDQFPHLRNDVDFSILDQFKLKSTAVGWIGPAGTVTGYHIDWGDNILAQICGRKCLHLVAPEETASMYVSKKFDHGTTISEVDLHAVDESRFPKFREATHHKIILHPGQMVFIPRGWWHHVESLDRSISVSNIGYDIKGILFDVIPHRIKQNLHDAGLWKCDCTCHIEKEGKWIKK